MAYSIRCADTGSSCPGAFTTPTKEELLEHLRIHMAAAHPEMEMNPETESMVQGLIKTG